MDTTRFDQLATTLASSSNRRQALKSLVGIASAVAVAGALRADPGEARRRKSRKGKGKGSQSGSGSSSGGHGTGSSGQPQTPRDMCPVSAKYNAPVCGSEPGGGTCDCHRTTEGNNFCGGTIDTCASLQPCTSTQDCRNTVGFHFFCQAADGGACGQVCVPECANTNPF